jgi:hypothetical protein
MHSISPEERQADPRKAFFCDVRDELVKRTQFDRAHTVDSIDFALMQLVADPDAGLDAEGELCAQTLKVQMLDVSCRCAVLEQAYTELRSLKDDFRQQGAVELLAGLATHEKWLAEDDGTPTVNAARAGLAKRARQRELNAWKYGTRFVDVEQERDGVFGEAAPISTSELRMEEIDARMLEALPEKDHPKWERLCMWVIDDIPQEEVAGAYGMNPGAFRKEVSRFKSRAGEILAADLDGEVAGVDPPLPHAASG